LVSLSKRADRCCTCAQLMSEIEPWFSKIPIDFDHIRSLSRLEQWTCQKRTGKHDNGGQLLFADKDHIPHNPPLFSQRITVHVATPVERTPSAPGARIYFVGLHDGDTVPQHTTIHFGLENMGVAPAGIERPNTGHHHLLVDAELPPLISPSQTTRTIYTSVRGRLKPRSRFPWASISCSFYSEIIGMCRRILRSCQTRSPSPSSNRDRSRTASSSLRKLWVRRSLKPRSLCFALSRDARI
jgi:hypothetical protein